MVLSKSGPRVLQQQPRRNSDPQQQQSGSREFQSKAAPRQRDQQMGEASDEGKAEALNKDAA